MEVNADGLRDDPHDRAREPGLYRIAVIGDSYTLAWQIALEDTYFRVAARALGDCEHVPAERGVETINFGMAGYGTAQELRTYEMRARAYSPDLVVLAFLSGNDVSENHPDLDANSMRPHYVFRDGRLELDDSFLERAAYRGRQSLRWRVGVAASEYSRVVQLFNEFRNRSVDALRTRAEAERRGALGEDGEIGDGSSGSRLPGAAHERAPAPSRNSTSRARAAARARDRAERAVLARIRERRALQGPLERARHRVAGEHLARSLSEHFARGALGARRAGRRSASRPPGPRRGRTLCDSS